MFFFFLYRQYATGTLSYRKRALSNEWDSSEERCGRSPSAPRPPHAKPTRPHVLVPNAHQHPNVTIKKHLLHCYYFYSESLHLSSAFLLKKKYIKSKSKIKNNFCLSFMYRFRLSRAGEFLKC